LRAHELVDVPDWAWSTAYDVTGTYPDGTVPTDAESRAMLHRLTAVQEQLGLRLDSTQAAFDVVVIERLERPTPD
jgi:hypothetical protein